MNKAQVVFTAVALTGLLAACDSASDGNQAEAQATTETQAAAPHEILFYRHPMNPEITSPVPAEDSMGMPYIPVYADRVSGVFSISPGIVQSLGVATTVVEKGDLPRRIETVGYVTYNESLLHHVHVRTPGWVTQAAVFSIGERVTAGQKLFAYFAPELVTAQREYLNAISRGSRQLLQASQERLLSLGMAEREISALTKTHEIIRETGFYAQREGYITSLDVRHGMYLTPETEALGIAPLDSVWVRAEVFPQQMRWLAPGQTATVTLPGLPDKVFTGTLDYLAPQVDPVTRARTVRLTLANPEHALLSGAYAKVSIEAAPLRQVVHVPLDAVIRTGDVARVVLALGDGRFMSRTVIPGETVGEWIVTLSGLTAGERVVTSAQFLLDSEASLRQSANRIDTATTQPEAPGHESPADTPAAEHGQDHRAGHGAADGDAP